MADEIVGVPMDKLARVYRKMRDRAQALTAEYDKALLAITTQQDAIKAALKDRMLAMGVTSVRTAEGTVSIKTSTRYSTQDWDSFKQFVIEHQAIDLFEKRIAQGNMAQFLESNPGLLPPGLNSFSEYSVSVRKPTN